VTRGWLPQRAGLPSLNGGGTAAAVPRTEKGNRTDVKKRKESKKEGIGKSRERTG